MATGTARDSPRAPKVRLGLSEQPNPSYTYAKVRLGRSWSAKVSKSAQDTSWRFLTSKCCLWTDEYSLLQKVDFRKEIIFRSLQKIINFCQMRFGMYFTDVWGGSGRSKRAKSLKWHLFTTWRPKMTQVLQPLCFPMWNQWFWDSKTHFGAQNAFWSNLSTLGARK